jgi:hypothetical protein
MEVRETLDCHSGGVLGGVTGLRGARAWILGVLGAKS